ncbi:hypothetical protein [Priestia aryabhattai]
MLRKHEANSQICSDLKIETKKKMIPLTIISDGKIV